MGGKTVTIRLNEQEYKRMKEISEIEGFSIGQLTKKAVWLFWFSEGLSQKDTKKRILIDEIIKKEEEMMMQQQMVNAMKEYFRIGLKINQPDFLDWLYEDEGGYMKSLGLGSGVTYTLTSAD